MTDTAKSIAQFKAQRDAQIEAYRQAGDPDATLKGWATYATRLELHCQANASRMARLEAKLKKLEEADETGKLDQDGLYSHEYDGVEYLTTSEGTDEDCVRVFVGGVEVTEIVSDSFMSVAESAHFWASENGAREARDERRISAFIERRESAGDNYVGPM